MATLSAKLLEQLRRVAQEVPASTLDSLLRVLMTVSFSGSSTLKHKLLPLLPRASWRQLTNDLIDVWQTEATLLDGNAIATALATAAHCQDRLQQELTAELVWTGPNPDALPLRRTDQALLQLIRAAQQDLLIVSFAIYNIPEIVQALIAALDRGVKVRIIAETPEASDGKISFGMATTFGREILERFQIYVWPKEKRPVDEHGRYGSLHAKCAVCDYQQLFISSANLTAYAMSLNIEMGILIQNCRLARQVVQQMDQLIFYGDLTLWESDSS
ncbi:hypothetical protein JOY44_26025 (plasmid) [Phormidium sp. CLA17]|uniref:DISARM system phospholipase D-like protein DrmC n=1 Tax=Leptolyngbya sp. Cla-17 TaxID=2803751 RepID=UPI001492B034|nr:DISARM system phospholipase D-like protein DrmC [Leptolyngbya sp. Cla-17]MBM0744980.1 hypothetical protein [Leptolyngbya sp. Cla-17]